MNNKYPSVSIKSPNNDKFEFVEGIRNSGKFEYEKTMLMLSLIKEAEKDMFEWTGIPSPYIKVSKPLDPQYYSKKEKTLTELLDEGKSFKEINKIMKERNKI